MDPLESLDALDLARKYNSVNFQLKKLQGELDNRRKEDRHIVRQKDWIWRTSKEQINLDFKKTHRVANLIAPELGFNVYNYKAFVVEIPPGGQEGAYHRHGEAVKYYLAGRGLEIIGDKQYEVEAGDVMYVPADTWHGTQNPYDEPLRFFAVGYTDIGVPLMRPTIFLARDDLKPHEPEAAPPQKNFGEMDGWEIAKARSAILRELAPLELEMERRRKMDKHHTKAKDLDWRQSGVSIGMKAPAIRRGARAVAPELGFNVYNFVAFFLELGAGGTEGAYHSHGEAIKYYVSGRGREIIGDKEYEVEAGDAVFVPANVWHGTQNPYSEPVRFFAIAQGRRAPLAVQVPFKIREDLKDHSFHREQGM